MQRFFFLALEFIFAAALFAKTPQWVKNPSKVYPSKDFFAAVGNGKTEQQAELSAVENLAAIFGRNVRSSSKTSSRMQQAEANGTVSTGMSADLSKDIMQRVSVEDLMGVELKEYYQDDKKFYALAVMDKKKTEEILLSSMKANNARIDKLLSEKKSSELYTLETYARYDFAREIAELDEKMLSKLEVINVKSAEEIKEQLHTQASIRTKMMEIAKAIPIRVKVEGDGDGSIFQSVSEMFGAYGFRVAGSSSARYVFYAKTQKLVRETDDKRTVQCIYSFEGQLKDEKLAEFLWSTSFTGRESSASREMLPSKTQRSMAKKISGESGRSFGKFLSDMRAE